jgi:hypothetical protein
VLASLAGLLDAMATQQNWARMPAEAPALRAFVLACARQLPAALDPRTGAMGPFLCSAGRAQRQQDAEEFLGHLLDALVTDKDSATAAPGDESALARADSGWRVDPSAMVMTSSSHS